MKTRTKLICVLVIIAMAVISISVNAETSTYGDVICNEKFFPRHIYYCQYPDGHLKGFNTYEAMNAYFVPPLEETFIPETTYIYGSGTETLTAK